MTEEDAKTKWCPFSRYLAARKVGEMAAHLPAAVNRGHYGAPEVGTMCIGSACMAWRSHLAGLGYCGLAGGPGALQ